MITTKLLDDSTDIPEEEQASYGRRVAVGILCAVLLTAGVFGGYLYLRNRHARENAARELAEANQIKPALPPRAQIRIPFKTLPGAQRPLEKTPDGKTIVVSRPRPRGEEFINTPDNPAKVP